MRSGRKPQDFKPGKSGNPGGRPKLTQEDYDLRAACKAKGKDALKVLLRIMDKGREENQLKSAIVILERGFGKPDAKIEHSGIITLAEALRNSQ